MSEIQTHVGRLIKLKEKFESIKDFEIYLSKLGINLSICKDEYPNYILYYDDKDLGRYPRYIYINPTTIFEVENNYVEYSGYIDFCEKFNDDEYKYIFQYYDGGTCFSEMLSEHLNNIYHESKRNYLNN